MSSATAAAFDAAIAAAATRGDEMMRLVRRLFPICRSITGAGLRETLDILGERMPLERHRVPSGTQCYDWIVPPEWNVRDAFVANSKGDRVIDFRRNNLHLVSYSVPVDAHLTLRELRPRLHSLPDVPDAIPYRTTYYHRDWGFCLSDRQLRQLPEDTYHVRIDSTLAPGFLDFATATLGSGAAGEVLLSSYVCHPSMANNELSGPVVLATAYELLREVTGLRHRYRFLLNPETIGSIAFLSLEGPTLQRSLRAGYVVTCVGDDGPYTYKRSRRGDTLADRAAEHALRHACPAERLRVLRFDPKGGSDERQYCSPGFDLPFGSLSRSLYGTYPEYHTSLDDLSFVSESGLEGSLVALLRILETIELDERYVRTNPYGEPQLGRRGLYPSLGAAKTVDEQVARLLYLLNFSDGQHDLIDIAELIGEPVWQLVAPLEMLLSADLLRPIEVSAREATQESGTFQDAESRPSSGSNNSR